MLPWGGGGGGGYRKESEAKERMSMWSRIWRYVSVAISVAALGYLVYKLWVFDWDSLQWGGMNWCLIGLATMVFPLPVVIEAWRWQVIMRGMREMDFKEALGQVLSGLKAGFITPYRLGEYPARVAEMQGGEVVEDQRSHGETPRIQWGNWREWLKDWQKWLAVIGITVLKYVVWGCQLWVVLGACGVPLGLGDALAAITTYYVCISVFPSVPAADVGVKGGWATLIFGAYGGTAPQMTVVVSLIWLCNTILPLVWALGRSIRTINGKIG